MPLNTAQSFAWNLATTLMVAVILFQTAEGYGVLPASEYDGDPEQIITDYDPFGL
ncbi:hypothetical protein [Sphingosinicella rhizophila]|uniref:Uncharacterized protein n=1 Tax=Sphingosinicella rhizophila TaxID=3050082 RepID=A0ABU3QAI1_9SPHN|nr:hypothetical protein [Sphingosinicella sp. GR2756]MDT9600426.1 hypothetical protein [Sphingosinicella sp. GR2756]